MILAIAALLIQPAFFSQISSSAEEIALSQPADSGNSVSAISPVEVASLPDAPTPRVALAPPSTDSDSAVAATASEPEAASASAPAALILPKPYTVSVKELQAEDRPKQQLWMGLGIASHAAAGFDAWSTRQAISSGNAHEMNPLLKPFAGNASLYVAIQAGPALMDYVGKKMMYSPHSWARRIWWVPQSASFLSSLICGAHNLGVQGPSN